MSPKKMLHALDAGLPLSTESYKFWSHIYGEPQSNRWLRRYFCEFDGIRQRCQALGPEFVGAAFRLAWIHDNCPLECAAVDLFFEFFAQEHREVLSGLITPRDLRDMGARDGQRSITLYRGRLADLPLMAKGWTSDRSWALRLRSLGFDRREVCSVRVPIESIMMYYHPYREVVLWPHFVARASMHEAQDPLRTRWC